MLFFFFFFFFLILSSPDSEDEATRNFFKTIFKSYFVFLVVGLGLAKASRLASEPTKLRENFGRDGRKTIEYQIIRLLRQIVDCHGKVQSKKRISS